jgi:hypothetical protein
MKTLIAAAALALGAVAAVSPANAAALIGGTTVVEVTAPIGALGLAGATLGSASVTTEGFFSFPVTGGDLAGLAGTIEHSGSGVRLSSATANVDLRNFLIDTVQQLIFADVSANGGAVGNIAVFSFDVASLPSLPDLFDLSDPALALILTDGAADALEGVFGLTAQLNGLQFGLAATAPIVTPLPGAIGFFMAGAAGLAALRRKRTAAARVS